MQLWCHSCSHSILIITQCKLCSCFVISLGIHLFRMSKKCSIIISIFLCYVIFCASLDMNGTQGRLKSIRNTLFSKTRAYNKACNNIYLSESFFSFQSFFSFFKRTWILHWMQKGVASFLFKYYNVICRKGLGNVMLSRDQNDEKLESLWCTIIDKLK